MDIDFFTQFEYVDFNMMLQLNVVNLNVGVMFSGAQNTAVRLC